MSDYELYHYGILGQKWGIRRFQNADGTLTAAGKKRRSSGAGSDLKKFGSKVSSVAKKVGSAAVGSSKRLGTKAAKTAVDKVKNRPKPVSKMSDSELREWLNRYDMEQRYLKATRKSNPIIKAGKEIVGNTLKNGIQNWANKKVNDWINKEDAPNSHNLFGKDPSELSDKDLTEANKRRASEELYRQNENTARERSVDQEYQNRENERYQEWLRSRQGLHHGDLE